MEVIEKFRSNCLFAALLAWAESPGNTRISFIRNRAGRLHCIWERDGRKYEFYAKGRSKLGYLRNALYRGYVKQLTR